MALFGDEGDTAKAAAQFASFGDAITLWRQRAGSELAVALGLTTGAAVVRPDAYLGRVAGGGVVDAARDVADWLRSSLRLVER